MVEVFLFVCFVFNLPKLVRGIFPMLIGLLERNVFLWKKIFFWRGGVFHPLLTWTHSRFVPACPPLVPHVSLPHVFTLHSSSVIELCSYWLGDIWAGMLHSWNWQPFLVSKGEPQWDLFKHKHLVLKWKKDQVLLMPEPLQQFVSLAQENWYAYFLQFFYLSVAVLLECFLSIRTHFYSFWPFFFISPFLSCSSLSVLNILSLNQHF